VFVFVRMLKFVFMFVAFSVYGCVFVFVLVLKLVYVYLSACACFFLFVCVSICVVSKLSSKLEEHRVNKSRHNFCPYGVFGLAGETATVVL